MKEIRIGCDYCGEPKEVKKAKFKITGSRQWQNLYLCKDCIKLKL